MKTLFCSCIQFLLGVYVNLGLSSVAGVVHVRSCIWKPNIQIKHNYFLECVLAGQVVLNCCFHVAT